MNPTIAQFYHGKLQHANERTPHDAMRRMRSEPGLQGSACVAHLFNGCGADDLLNR